MKLSVISTLFHIPSQKKNRYRRFIFIKSTKLILTSGKLLKAERNATSILKTVKIPYYDSYLVLSQGNLIDEITLTRCKG